VTPDFAKINIAYVSPGSPVVHVVHLTLNKTNSDGEADYFAVFRDGRQCGSLNLRPSKNDNIVLATTEERTQAFSRMSEVGVRALFSALQRTADLQRGYANKGLIKGYWFLSEC
jgi:hypothetical protein